MALTQLAKPQWQDYFDRVSKVLGAKLVEIEVTGLGLGDQVEVDWLPLIGLSYDPRGDVLAVMVEGIEHNIWHPKQIHVEQDVEGLYSIEVVDTAEEHHILLLKDPLKLSQLEKQGFLKISRGGVQGACYAHLSRHLKDQSTLITLIPLIDITEGPARRNSKRSLL